jgi:hypothetical protein
VLGVRAAADAVATELRQHPGHVRRGAELGVDVHGTGERGPGLAAIVGADKLSGRRFQRFRLL